MLAVDASGKLYAWGDNRSGSLGDGTTINKSSPVLISTSGGGLFNRITAISGQRSGFGAGQGASLAIDNLGKAFVWGNNFTGQMGDGTTVNKSSPTLLPSNTGPQTLTKIVETSGSAYGIDQAQNIWGIGLNSSGQLGDGTTVNKTTFTQNTFFNANVQNIAVGTSHVVVQTPTSI
jgi:alpha-tubulin suppressor-like RCC1 family protein